MSKPTEPQIILDPHGNPAFVVIPYDEFVSRYEEKRAWIPNEVVEKTVMEGASPIRAWREHLGLTQEDVARRLGITQSAFAQLETSRRPRKTTLRRVADALGIEVEQLTI